MRADPRRHRKWALFHQSVALGAPGDGVRGRTRRKAIWRDGDLSTIEGAMSKFAWAALAAWEAYCLWFLVVGDEPRRALLLLIVPRW